MASSKELEQRPQVDPRDEPSADWGWHGEFPRAVQVMGLAIAVFLLAMLIGPHKGNTENLWLIGTAVTIVLLLLWDLRKRRTAWRR